MRCFVTGCAGFIGSHMVDRLLADGHEVVGYDNLSTGRERFLEGARAFDRFRFVRGDTLDADPLRKAMLGSDLVIHLAAHADVRFGVEDPRRDVEQNTLATFNVLEAMRDVGARRIAFASTASVYGDARRHPTPEDAPFPVQTSFYGASKLAAEGLIAACAEGFGFKAYIFRLVSILGERYHHGHVFDFYKKLLADPHEIEVLGDGRQRKSYLHVQDCIDAMLTVLDRAEAPVNLYNLGAEESCTVDDSLGWICARLGLEPRRRYAGGDRGWVGDSPFILVDTTRVRSLGWRARVSIRDAVLQTVESLQANPWILDRP